MEIERFTFEIDTENTLLITTWNAEDMVYGLQRSNLLHCSGRLRQASSSEDLKWAILKSRVFATRAKI